MGTNKNVVVSFSIAILLLLSLLLLLTYNSKCNQSHNNGSMMMQSSQNQGNLGNYSKTPEPFYFEKFTTAPSATSATSPNSKFASALTSRPPDSGKLLVQPQELAKKASLRGRKKEGENLAVNPS